MLVEITDSLFVDPARITALRPTVHEGRDYCQVHMDSEPLMLEVQESVYTVALRLQGFGKLPVEHLPKSKERLKEIAEAAGGFVQD